VELLKDGAPGGGERRQSREGLNGPQRGDCEGDDGAEWNGVRTSFVLLLLKDEAFVSVNIQSN
jgi:hypothetical protein